MKSHFSPLLILLSGLLLIAPFAYMWSDKSAQTLSTLDGLTRPVQQALKLAAPDPDWLSTKGRFIVNEKGERVILRGVNVSSINWGTDEWNEKAVTYAITQWKANVIRTRVFQDEYAKNPKAFFEKMEWQILRPARKQGAYVILHPWIHDNQAMPDEGTVAMWAAIAKRYAHDPAVIYDVLAEPRGVSFSTMRKAYIKLIEAVRAQNPRSLIFVSGLGWGRDINQWLGDPLPYENIVYRSNPYNKAGEFQSLFGEIALEYPVFLGEFGSGGYPPMTEESVQALITFANETDLGWTAWNFSEQGCPCLLSNESLFIPTSYGKLVKTALASGPTALTLTTPKPKDPSRYYVFSDYLENGFLDYSWGGKVNLQSERMPYFGGKTIQADISSNGALALQTDTVFDQWSYRSLTFALAALNGQKVKVRVRTNQDRLTNEVEIESYKQAGQTNAPYSTYRVPMEAFDLNPDETLAGIIIGNASVATQTVLLDEVYFAR